MVVKLSIAINGYAGRAIRAGTSIALYNANLICSSFITLLSSNIFNCRRNGRSAKIRFHRFYIPLAPAERNDLSHFSCNYSDKTRREVLFHYIYFFFALRNRYVTSQPSVRFLRPHLGNVYQFQITAIDKTYRARCLILACRPIFKDFSPPSR